MGKFCQIPRILLATGVVLCYMPCVIMKSALINSVMSIMLLCSPASAAQAAAAEAVEPISEAATQAMAVANAGVERLAELLVRVEDAASAAELLPQIAATLESVRALEAGDFAEDDEEMVAAGFANDWYLLVEEEVVRLIDAGFYGNAQLRLLLEVEELGEEAAEQPAELPRSASEAPVQEAGTESLLPG